MKKLFTVLLAFALMLTVQKITFAEIQRFLGHDCIRLSSFTDIAEMAEKERPYSVRCLFLRERTGQNDDFYKISLGAYNWTKNVASPLYFSFKKPAKIEVRQGEDKKRFAIKKKFAVVDSYGIDLTLSRKLLDSFYAADKVTFIIPLAGKGVERFEVPDKILEEWRHIMDANLD